jgi:hypothetical protein
VGDPAVSDEICYEVEVAGDAPEDRLQALVDQVDEIAEIPNSLRQGTRGYVWLERAWRGTRRASYVQPRG